MQAGGIIMKDLKRVISNDAAWAYLQSFAAKDWLVPMLVSAGAALGGWSEEVFDPVAFRAANWRAKILLFPPDGNGSWFCRKKIGKINSLPMTEKNAAKIIHQLINYLATGFWAM